MRVNLMVYRQIDRPLASADFGKYHEETMRRHDARPRPYDRRFQGLADRSRSGPGGFLCYGKSSPGRGRVCRRRFRDLVPGRRYRHRPRCSPTSNGSAMSTSRTGSRPKAWMRQDRDLLRRSRQDGVRCMVGGEKPGIFVRSLSTIARPGAHAGGRASLGVWLWA